MNQPHVQVAQPTPSRSVWMVLLLTAMVGVISGVVVSGDWLLPCLAMCGLVVAGVGTLYPVWAWKLLLVIIIGLRVTTLLPNSVASIMCWGGMLVFFGSSWLAQWKSRQSVLWGHTGVWVCTVAWLSWACVSMWYSPVPAASLKEVIRYGLCITAWLTYINWIRSRTQLEAMVNWFIRLLAVTMCWVLARWTVQFALGNEPLRFLGSDPMGETEGPVGIGWIIILWIPVASSCMRHAVGRARRLEWLGLVCAVVWLLLCSGSRAAILASSLAALVVAAIQWPEVARRLCVPIGVVIICGVVMLHWRFGGVLHVLIAALSGRELLWAAALTAVSQHPLVGVGPGFWKTWHGQNYVSADFLVYDAQGQWYYQTPGVLEGEAHNLLLSKAAEMGWPSAVLLVVWIVLWVAMTGYVIRHVQPSIPRDMAIGSLGACAGMLWLGIFENVGVFGQGTDTEAILLWFVLALPTVVAVTNGLLHRGRLHASGARILTSTAQPQQGAA